MNIHEKYVLSIAKEMKKQGVSLNVSSLSERSGIKKAFLNRMLENKLFVIALLKIENRINVNGENNRKHLSIDMFEKFFKITPSFELFIDKYNKGEKNKNKIARDIGVSKVTVSNYFKRILLIDGKIES